MYDKVPLSKDSPDQDLAETAAPHLPVVVRARLRRGGLPLPRHAALLRHLVLQRCRTKEALSVRLRANAFSRTQPASRGATITHVAEPVAVMLAQCTRRYLGIIALTTS